MTAFRPCIDLHQGKVKQIVGGTLSDDGAGLTTNFVSDQDSRWFAELYKGDGLAGGHVIMLGPGNDQAAKEALRAFPGGLQIGGGLDAENCLPYLDAGASHVIVTSWLFPGGELSLERLRSIAKKIGKERLVVDLSCRRRAGEAGEAGAWYVAMDRWQTVTRVRLDEGLFAALAAHCDEFLIHAADVEGKCEGMDWDLVDLLTRFSPLPATYAGGSRDAADLASLERRSGGRLDLSIGSALDIFGGRWVKYADCAAFNRSRR
jgi:phosphoribosylformimino-5-aminoimidazole carboxamide ribotide isomerase